MILLLQSGGDAPVHYTLGSSILALVVHAIWKEWKDSKRAGSELEYWERMEQRVTRPIVEAVRELKTK